MPRKAYFAAYAGLSSSPIPHLLIFSPGEWRTNLWITLDKKIVLLGLQGRTAVYFGYLRLEQVYPPDMGVSIRFGARHYRIDVRSYPQTSQVIHSFPQVIHSFWG